ncbi:MAG: 4Fe-4S binding protein [Prolixibacteraceae bacterium]|nr:4Fe-4S binding protein [Prolixibacteraceae bacterium]
MNTRRNFLSTLLKSGALLTFYPLMNACTKEGVSPFQAYVINTELCNGCGDCVSECAYDAIVLPVNSTYHIDESICTECMDCVSVCPQNAIKVSGATYSINEEHCVGCGDCIDVCVNEANCITFERDYYSVRNKCRNRSCQHECVSVCPQDAIVKQDGSIAIIDMDKCDRCGKCVSACPHDAINPAKVMLDEGTCIRCGKCYPVCGYDAINKEKPEGYTPPFIDEDLCDSCGDCINACVDYSAIVAEIFHASINENKCQVCGDCVTSCEKGAIVKPFY